MAPPTMTPARAPLPMSMSAFMSALAEPEAMQPGATNEGGGEGREGEDAVHQEGVGVGERVVRAGVASVRASRIMVGPGRHHRRTKTYTSGVHARDPRLTTRPTGRATSASRSRSASVRSRPATGHDGLGHPERLVGPVRGQPVRRPPHANDGTWRGGKPDPNRLQNTPTTVPVLNMVLIEHFEWSPHEQPGELAAAREVVAGDGVPDRDLAVVVLQVRRVGVGAQVAPPAQIAVAEVAIVALGRERVRRRSRGPRRPPFDPLADGALVDPPSRLDGGPGPEPDGPLDDSVLAHLGAVADPDRPVGRAHDGAGADRRPDARRGCGWARPGPPGPRRSRRACPARPSPRRPP